MDNCEILLKLKFEIDVEHIYLDTISYTICHCLYFCTCVLENYHTTKH
jgi:hypothetical protein